ncbi:MAG: pectate lyase [Bacteroidales bacterium]
MKKILLLALLASLVLSSVTAQLPAFPGAEGYGRFVSGGRGGEVCIVTNLSDSVVKPPEGSLRWALNKPGPKTIIFEVSGTIELKRRLNISKGDVTIAGQTAPGDGICISGETVSIESDNVIIRYVRFRCGNDTPGEEPKDAVSCIRNRNIIIDHCSMSWSVDEAASFYDNENFTLQWCIISESLYDAGHPKGEHGYGGIWGGKGATFHHNLLASHTSRLPRFCGARYHPDSRETEIVDFRNNVIFNWGFNSSYGGELGQQNIINNYYKPGPATKKSVISRIVEPFDSLGRWYIGGNHVVGNRVVSTGNWLGGVQGDYAGVADIRAASPFPFAPVKTEKAFSAYRSVLRHAGATLPRPDSQDRRIIIETKTGSCTYGDSYGAGTGIIDSQNSVGGWPLLKTYNVQPDTDRDGMPDAWETKRGLNPSDPADRNAIAKSGYTMLEEYINGISKR